MDKRCGHVISCQLKLTIVCIDVPTMYRGCVYCSIAGSTLSNYVSLCVPGVTDIYRPYTWVLPYEQASWWCPESYMWLL